MRKLILIGIVMGFMPRNSVAQNRNNVWMLSYPSAAAHCGVDFNSGVADTFSVEKDLQFFYTDASICDTLGQLLFYTNGVYIANRNHDSLFNTQDYNPGAFTDIYDEDGLGLPQAALILPKPMVNELYNIIHVSGEVAEAGHGQPFQLRLTEVDMTLDSGLGGVVATKKNIYLLEDTLVLGRLTACKHANGRDWWLITHKWNSDLYYKLLLTPDTIYGPFEQHIGSVIIKDDPVGQASFSPDGSKYCMVNCNYNFDYMEFDRCSGDFSNPVNIVLDSNLTQGCAFSPNSRFLYINNYNQIYQYDTWSNDLEASEIMVDTIPFIQVGIADWFSMMQLAPDNKIYISTYNGTKALHVISEPDILDTACNFTRKGLVLPSYNAPSIPNHPNYDLGPLQGSPCDTLYLQTNNSVTSNQSFRIYPNPVSDWLNIIYQTNQDALLELFDMYGKRAGAVSLYPYFKNRLLNVSGLPAGVYSATVTENEKIVWQEKVVVAR